MRTLPLAVLLFFSIGLLNPSGITGFEFPPEKQRYPVPERTEKLLFYLQRTYNRNTVIYELNFRDDGMLDNKDPVHPSWIVYEEGEVRRELTFRQKWVYGVHVRPLGKDAYLLHFKSYKKRDVYLMRTGKNNCYKALINIKGKMAELTNLYVGTENNLLGIPSIVQYVDIYGTDPLTGNVVSERVIR